MYKTCLYTYSMCRKTTWFKTSQWVQHFSYKTSQWVQHFLYKTSQCVQNFSYKTSFCVQNFSYKTSFCIVKIIAISKRHPMMRCTKRCRNDMSLYVHTVQCTYVESLDIATARSRTPGVNTWHRGALIPSVIHTTKSTPWCLRPPLSFNPWCHWHHEIHSMVLRPPLSFNPRCNWHSV